MGGLLSQALHLYTWLRVMRQVDIKNMSVAKKSLISEMKLVSCFHPAFEWTSRIWYEEAVHEYHAMDADHHNALKVSSKYRMLYRCSSS